MLFRMFKIPNSMFNFMAFYNDCINVSIISIPLDKLSSPVN